MKENETQQAIDHKFWFCGFRDRVENPRHRGCIILSDNNMFICMPKDEKDEPKRFDHRIPSFSIILLVGLIVAFFCFVVGLLLFGPPPSDAPRELVASVFIPVFIYLIWATIMILKRNRLEQINPLKKEFDYLRNLYNSDAKVEEGLSFLRNLNFGISEYMIGDLADTTFQRSIWRKEWIWWRRMKSKSNSLDWVVLKQLEGELKKRLIAAKVKTEE